MADLTIGTDLLTFDSEPPSRITTRSQSRSRAISYLPLSGREDIRSRLSAIRRFVMGEMADSGLDMIVETTDAHAEAQLWSADETAWYLLATTNTNTIVLDKSDVLRLHGLTLRRILDPGAYDALQTQLDLSRLPPDPASNVAFERWHEQRAKNDVVWAYIRGHLPPDQKEQTVAPHKNGRRLNMALNSTTLYLYMVTLNPSAYGTHVRKLLRGAVQFAVHHVLARATLGADPATYAAEHVEPILQPYVRSVLSAPGIEVQVQTLVDESTEHTEAYARAKVALLQTLERTRLVRDVRSILNANSVDTSTRDKLFASLFSMYKLVTLIRSAALFLNNASGGQSSGVEALQAAAAGFLREIDDTPKGTEHATVLRNARKISQGIRDFSANTRPINVPAADTEYPSGVVAKHTESMILALYNLTVIYIRVQLIEELRQAPGPDAKNAPNAHEASRARRILRIHRDYKHGMATLKALVSRALRMLRAGRYTLSKTGSVAQALGFMYLRIKAVDKAIEGAGAVMSVSGRALVAELAKTKEAFATTATTTTDAYHRIAGGEGAKEPYVMNIANFGSAVPQHHRTDTTVAMIDTFLLTGLFRTLHDLDKTVSVVVFELVARKKAKPPPVEYTTAITELREALTQLIMERRRSVTLRHVELASSRLRVTELSRILEQHAQRALHLIMDRIYDSPLGVAFACSANSIRDRAGMRPYGVTPTFERQWALISEEEKPSLTSVRAAGEIYDSDLSHGVASRIDLSRPYVYEDASTDE
jgi:hypothetical protein